MLWLIATRSASNAFVVNSNSNASLGATEEPVQSDSVDQEPPISISPADLLREYEKNEVAADSRYKGRTLIVRGKIARIGRDIGDTAYVSFKNDHPSFRSVQCFFGRSAEAQLGELSPGDEVLISGKCDGLFGTVSLKDCQLLD